MKTTKKIKVDCPYCKHGIAPTTTPTVQPCYICLGKGWVEVEMEVEK